ncbi:MATE family efflux transporter [Mycoplasmatota bacterium]|nr:MATE family efflux transporter [Mycoplasmatota bacterium]
MEDKIYYTKNLNKTIIVLIIPIIIEMFLETMIGYVDVSMLGRLDKFYLASTEVSNSLIYTCLVLANAFSLGGTVLVTKYIGAEDNKNRNKTIGQTISIGIIFSLVFLIIFYFFSTNFLKLMGAKDSCEAMVLTNAKAYMSIMTFSIPILMFRQMFVGLLRGMGKTKIPMYLSGLNIILNIIFNTIFIYDHISVMGLNINLFGLAIRGAAIATLTSRSISLVLLILYFIKIAKFKLKISDFIFTKPILSGIFSVGIPTALEMMIFRAGMLKFLSMVTTLGPTAISAHAVANAAESLSFTPGNAFNVVIVTLVGQFLGAKNYMMAKECIKKTDRLAIIFMGTMGLFFLLIPFVFIRLFTNDADVIRLSSSVLRIEALAQVFFARYYVYSGLMRTIGKSKQIFFVTSSSVWLVRITIAHFLLNYTELGLAAAWIAMSLDYVYRAAFLTILANRNMKKIFQSSQKTSNKFNIFKRKKAFVSNH